MNYMVAWKEYDERLNNEVQCRSYFETEADAMQLIEELLEYRFKGIQFKNI